VQQQPQPKQQNHVGLSQVIKEIAQQVANANPGTNATQVYEILVQLAKVFLSLFSSLFFIRFR
jgi:hypothetical protein